MSESVATPPSLPPSLPSSFPLLLPPSLLTSPLSGLFPSLTPFVALLGAYNHRLTLGLLALGCLSIPPSLPANFRSPLPPSLPPHRVRLVKPVILSTISPSFPKSNPSPHPSLPPSLPPSPPPYLDNSSAGPEILKAEEFRKPKSPSYFLSSASSSSVVRQALQGGREGGR